MKTEINKYFLPDDFENYNGEEVVGYNDLEEHKSGTLIKMSKMGYCVYDGEYYLFNCTSFYLIKELFK